MWIRYEGPGGQVRETTGQSDPRVAERMLRDRKREVAMGTWRPRDASDAQTVRAYSARWLERMRARGVRTVDDYEQRTRDHVLPLIGERLVSSLRPRDVAAFVLALTTRGLAPRTVRHIYDCLRSMCRDAVIEDVIAATPCVLSPGTLPAARDADPAWRMTALFTALEVETLISSPRVPPDRRVMYGLMGLAGLRFGEAAGRRWRDIDAALPLARMIVATQYDGERLKTDTPREVPVHPVLGALLEEWRSAGWPAMYGRDPLPGDLIVPSRRGAIRSVRHGHTRLVEDCERHGMRPRRQHDLRRTMISLARAGGARGEVLRCVTHGAPRAVLDLYTTWPWATLCEAVVRLPVGAQSGAHEADRIAEVPRMQAWNERGGRDLKPRTRGGRS